jgi:hypothetical protein
MPMHKVTYELIQDVIDHIRADLEAKDDTALVDLLATCSIKDLVKYLPDDYEDCPDCIEARTEEYFPGMNYTHCEACGDGLTAAEER